MISIINADNSFLLFQLQPCIPQSLCLLAHKTKERIFRPVEFLVVMRILFWFLGVSGSVVLSVVDG